MKKLILLVLSLVLCLCMVNTAFAATTPSDVVGTKYETAVKTLVESNVINGYEDGTYKPSENVTRAQLAKIICEALHLENVEDGVIFSDVAPEHWATSYIKIASKNSIITGYADGTFKPEANVTYAEAVTMIMRATGNDVGVSSTGKWYDNYMSKAKEKNILNNITGVTEDQNLNRGDTALLTYNMLQSGNVTTGSGDTGKQEGELVDVDDINKYNGTYKNGDNKIILYRVDENQFRLTIMQPDAFALDAFLDVTSDSKLRYTDESKNEYIEIVMTDNGIKCSANYSEPNGSFNCNDVEFTRDTFEKTNWDGVYKNEELGYIVVLAERNKNDMYITIKGNTYNYGRDIKDYADTQIDYNADNFGNTDTVKITKTNDGIKIEASSTDSSSKLNLVSGEYKRVNG